MRGINWGRVFLGGIVAGIVVNISEFLLHGIVLKEAGEQAMKALGKTVPMGGANTVVWLIWGFLYGIAAVWLYAGIRPRYGAGPGTAAKAGFAIWLLGHFLCAIVFINMGLFSGGSETMPLIWTLVESIVATLVGAWLYKEEGATA
jgi:hypothetical protein